MEEDYEEGLSSPRSSRETSSPVHHRGSNRDGSAVVSLPQAAVHRSTERRQQFRRPHSEDLVPPSCRITSSAPKLASKPVKSAPRRCSFERARLPAGAVRPSVSSGFTPGHRSGAEEFFAPAIRP